MNVKTRWWMAAPLAAALVVAACGGDDDADATAAAEASEAPAATAEATAEPEAEATAEPEAEVTAEPEAEVTAEPEAEAETGDQDTSGTAAVVVFGDEEIAMGALLCYFEEQPRAGLGGVFTHTAQAQGTNEAGAAVILDLTRTRDEDGTVEDQLTVDVGDPRGEDFVGYRATGPEGMITFGEATVAADGVEVTDFESDPVPVSFDLACG
jgi:hypothetical protein